MTLEEELIKQFREQQQKFAYYMIALCVAGIGFSVHKTMGVGLKETQIPLAIAVLSWGASIYYGLRFIKYQIAALFNNSELLKVQTGNHHLTGANLQKIEIAREVILKDLNVKSDITMNLAKWQDRSFYFGIVSFVVWRVLEMMNVAN